VTGVIVPAKVLDQLGYGAYNFHPGPPTYPGWAPAHFALYERAAEFGATAHVMVARIDEGPIVGVEMFSIPPGASVAGLEGMAYARLSYLFWILAKPLATCSESLAQLPLSWSGKKNTRRDYAAICEIPLDIPRDELDRRINVFGGHHFGIAPTIHLHGVEFRAALPVERHEPPTKRFRQILLPHGSSRNEIRPERPERRLRLVSAITRGRRWLDELISGSVTDAEQIALRERCSVRHVNMTISLAFLAPRLVRAAVEGRLPRGINIERLRDAPAEWSRQFEALGLNPQQ
jgi:methionyl-tRNA formyltransferase